MNLYLISQDIVSGYETYDSAVVAAHTEADARNIHPSRFVTHISNGKWMGTYTGGGEYENETGSWVSYQDIDRVSVEFLGETSVERGLVLASFNAG